MGSWQVLVKAVAIAGLRNENSSFQSSPKTSITKSCQEPEVMKIQQAVADD